MDENLRQRIRYLAEHGGVWDDPVADIRRWVKAGVAILVGSGVIHVVVHLMD